MITDIIETNGHGSVQGIIKQIIDGSLMPPPVLNGDFQTGDFLTGDWNTENS